MKRFRKRDGEETEQTSGTKPTLAPWVDDAAIQANRHLPFKEWAPLFLRLRDVHGNIVPFHLNEIQQRLDDEWELQLRERGQVKMRVLKPRKVGTSTWAQGKMLRAVIERPGWHAGVMAHDDTGCDFVFDRTKVFHDNLPPEMKRTLVRNNKKELAYKEPHGSFLRVNVAKPRGAWGSGGDIHMMHLSERSKWVTARGVSKAQGQVAAILSAMPNAVEGVVVVDESTALGKANAFYDAWQDAKPNPHTRWGKDGFVRMFFPWFEHRDYRIVGKVPEDFFTEKEWAAEEMTLRRMGCDEEQLAWRRWYIAEKCGADLATFHQEMPSTDEEAFLASGESPLNNAAIGDRYKELDKRERMNPTPRFRIDIDGSPRPERFGELRFWHSRDHASIKKDDPERYVIVADPSGSGANDPCCAYVWDRQGNEQIAELHGHWIPSVFADLLYALGVLYGSPKMIVEAGPWGGHVIDALRRRGYSRLYFREALDQDRQTVDVDYGRYGWVTTGANKPRMVKALQQMWSERRIRINSLECIGEHLTYTKNGTKYEAAAGRNDDRVICCAIYSMWALEHPYEPKREAPPEVAVPWVTNLDYGGDDKNARRASVWLL